MPKIFSSFLSGFNVILPPKKGYCTDGGIFFSDFMLISEKKKGLSSEFCKFSLRFVRHSIARRCEPQLSTVFGGRKNVGIRKISVRKGRKKFRTFLRLWGTLTPTLNTAAKRAYHYSIMASHLLRQSAVFKSEIESMKKSNTGIIRCRCSSDLMSETGPVI